MALDVFSSVCAQTMENILNCITIVLSKASMIAKEYGFYSEKFSHQISNFTLITDNRNSFPRYNQNNSNYSLLMHVRYCGKRRQKPFGKCFGCDIFYTISDHPLWKNFAKLQIENHNHYKYIRKLALMTSFPKYIVSAQRWNGKTRERVCAGAPPCAHPFSGDSPYG